MNELVSQRFKGSTAAFEPTEPQRARAGFVLALLFFDVFAAALGFFSLVGEACRGS